MANFDFDVRISAELLNQLHNGEITNSMLLTMTLLYNWAQWSTGIVKQVSAGGLHTWSCKQYSVRTFSEALRKLELMGWITRRMKAGSHKAYAVTIHNYKVTDDAGKVQVINQKDITIWEEFPNGRCEEASDEGSDETSDETSDESSDKTSLESNLKANLKPNVKNESQDEGLLVSQTDSLEASSPSAPPFDQQEKDKSNPDGALGREQVKVKIPWHEEMAQKRAEVEEQVGFTVDETDKEYAADNLLTNDKLLGYFGVPYFTDDEIPYAEAMAHLLRRHDRSATWLTSMVKWMLEHPFWKKRLHPGRRGFKQLLKHLNTEEVVAQFNSHLAVEHEGVWEQPRDNVAYYYYTTEMLQAIEQAIESPAEDEDDVVPTKFAITVYKDAAEKKKYVTSFRESCKADDWKLTPEDKATWGYGDKHVTAAVRFVVEQKLTVTKDEFIGLMVEAMGTLTAAAAEYGK